MYKPIDIPYETIVDGKEVLNELSVTLVPISLRETDELYNIKDTILPLVEDGLSSVSQAVKIYERERRKTKKGYVQKENLPEEYDKHVPSRNTNDARYRHSTSLSTVRQTFIS